MCFQVEFDEFIFKFLNDNKLCDVINGLFMNDSAIGIKRRAFSFVNCNESLFDDLFDMNNLFLQFSLEIYVIYHYINAICLQKLKR